MMKYSTLIAVFALTASLANPAIAGGKYHYRHGGHSGKHYSGYSYNRHHGHYAAYAIGGLVLGSILGSALSHSNHSATQYVERYPVYRERVYTNPYTEYSKTQGTFLRESNGDCFLINYNHQGHRVLTSVPNGNCK